MKTPDIRAYTIVEILFVAGIIVVLLILVFSAFQKALEVSRKVECLSNMKRLSAKVFQYANDHGGQIVPVVVFPSSTQGNAGWPWMTWLIDEGYLTDEGFDPEIAKQRPYPYDNLKKGVFTCGARKTPGSTVYNKMHYGMNWTLGFDSQNIGYKEPHQMPRLVNIASPSTTLMLGEVKYSYLIKAEKRFIEDGKDKNIEFPHGGRMNVIFFDGHAESSEEPWKLPVQGSTYPWF